MYLGLICMYISFSVQLSPIRVRVQTLMEIVLGVENRSNVKLFVELTHSLIIFSSYGTRTLVVTRVNETQHSEFRR